MYISGGEELLRYIERKIEVYTGIAYVLLVVFLILANLFPKLSFLFLLSIIPAVLIGTRTKITGCVLLTFITALASYFGFGLDKTAYSFLIYIIPSIVVGIIYRSGLHITLDFKIKSLTIKNEDQFLTYASMKVFLMGIMVFLMGSILYFIFKKYYLDENILYQMREMIKTAATNYTNLASKYSMSNKETESVMNTIIENSGAIVLTVCFIKATIIAMITYFIGIPISNKISKLRILYNGIDMIVLPGKPSYIYIACIVLGLLVNDINIPFLTPEIINTFVSIMSVLFFLEGVSLIIYVIRRWSSLKKITNWGLIMAVSLIIGGVFLGIVMIGVMDNIFEYRLKWHSHISTGGRDEI